MRRPGNRTLVIAAVCLALVAAGSVLAVRATRWNGSVTLLANWTGAGETAFREQVIAPFEAKEHIHVLYQGSTAESQVLKADVESGTPPDVAVLPGPGELASYARQGRLQPLDSLVRRSDFDAPWASRVAGRDNRLATYWVPIKTDLKSIVWYSTRRTDPGGLAAAAADPASWCVGMGDGATSGWPGTDWLEDILLQQAGPRVYQQWATGDLPWTSRQVRRAWQTWQHMVGAGQDRYSRPALLRDYDRAADGVGKGTCSLEHQASFVRQETGWKQAAPAYTSSAPLIPGSEHAQDTWEVSGDLAAMLTTSAQAGKLISYLARSDVQERWSRSQYGFSADRRVPPSAYGGDPVTRSLAGTLRDPAATRCYDASDAMPSTLRDAFELAALRFLAEPSTLDGQLRALERARLSKDNVWLKQVCGKG